MDCIILTCERPPNNIPVEVPPWTDGASIDIFTISLLLSEKAEVKMKFYEIAHFPGVLGLLIGHAYSKTVWK